MTIYNKTRDEKLQFDTNKETTKISALSFGKIDRYEYLTGEEILTSNSDGDLRFFVNGSILETDFSELKNPIAFETT